MTIELVMIVLSIAGLVDIGFIMYLDNKATDRAIEVYEYLLQRKDEKIDELMQINVNNIYAEERYDEIIEQLNKMDKHYDEVMEQLNIIKRITTKEKNSMFEAAKDYCDKEEKNLKELVEYFENPYEEETKMEKNIDYEKAFKMVKDQVIKERDWAEEDRKDKVFNEEETKGMCMAYGNIIRLIKHIEENENYGCLE